MATKARQKKKNAKKAQFHYTKKQKADAGKFSDAKHYRKKSLQKAITAITKKHDEAAYFTLRAVKQAMINNHNVTLQYIRSRLHDKTDNHDRDIVYMLMELEEWTDQIAYTKDDFRDILLHRDNGEKGEYYDLAEELHRRFVSASEPFEDYAKSYYETTGMLQLDRAKYELERDPKYQKYKREYEQITKEYEEWQEDVRNKWRKRHKQK